MFDFSSVKQKEVSVRGYSESLISNSQFKIPVHVLCSNFCPTNRDVYLRYILKLQPKLNMNLKRGSASHLVLESVFKNALELKTKQLTKEETENELKNIQEKNIEKISLETGADNIDNLKNLWQKQSEFVIENFEKILDYCSEMKVDGSKIGLSPKLKVDLFFKPQKAIIELKTGAERDYHFLTTTAYALAIESMTNEDVNNACLIYLRYFNKYPVFYENVHFIDDSLRKKVIELRDIKTKIVLEKKDPGKCQNCSSYCNYYNICHPTAAERFFS